MVEFSAMTKDVNDAQILKLIIPTFIWQFGLCRGGGI